MTTQCPMCGVDVEVATNGPLAVIIQQFDPDPKKIAALCGDRNQGCYAKWQAKLRRSDRAEAEAYAEVNKALRKPKYRKLDDLD